ncbi:Amino-acid acetyltransferase, mitochondrial [Cytospora mali]|uniref:Amino-acid acetyltransferase, mitochondrial n=1 Tax=Cytospora mali TaxID=578113 RepID=A0A194VXM4_CYTMA|nr:Amino-acid acetyltransferase, mitochondrial [Valsa mali]
MIRNTAWKKATVIAEASLTKRCNSSSSTTTATATRNFQVASPKEETTRDIVKEHYTSISRRARQKRSQERDFYVSVLESSSATKRDAKQYLKTFGPTVSQGPNVTSSQDASARSDAVESVSLDPLTNAARAISEAPQFVQGSVTATRESVDAVPHVAVIKWRLPQEVEDVTLKAVAKTLAQLRVLGMISVVVLDCEQGPRDNLGLRLLKQQVYRLAGAIDEYGEPWTTVIDSVLSMQSSSPGSLTSTFTPNNVVVDEEISLLTPLLRGSVVIIPPVVQHDDGKLRPVNPNDAVLSITRYLSGMQFAKQSGNEGEHDVPLSAPTKRAFVDRLIILDPLGGIPAKNRWNNAHLFLNLEDELETAKAHLLSMDTEGISKTMNEPEGASGNSPVQAHISNLYLAKDTLAMLPSTSSALITTPREAANLQPRIKDVYQENTTGFVGTVGTRRSHNPLIHNLLTDRPSHSSSLPLSRLKPIVRTTDPALNPVLSPTTLAKRGMPVTAYPDPGSTGWTPPKPGTPRLKLTDTCVDLPRLVHLIEDSFNRKLDVHHYLNRVEQSLAGIIIAGEYEGGAILTWERPFGMDEETAYEKGCLVPYLDKFAVLKKSQGAGGVADIVFNAMVRDCFPDGVCWRSRKNNPVNKWYFERSRGTMKLPASDWSMFWTTPGVTLKGERIREYEDVCRNILPSWADNKHILD